jgi:hypothetical protein
MGNPPVSKRTAGLCLAGIGVLIAAIALARAISVLRQRMAEAETEAAA